MPFKKECRFIALKLTDLDGLSAAERVILGVLLGRLEAVRVEAGLPPLNAVTIEDDWPMCMEVWDMIQDYAQMPVTKLHAVKGDGDA